MGTILLLYYIFANEILHRGGTGKYIIICSLYSSETLLQILLVEKLNLWKSNDKLIFLWT